MASVYIETTIPSFYFETRKKLPAPAWRLATRTWWGDDHRQGYDLCTSEVVHQEVDRAPEHKRDQCREMLRGIRVLPAVESLEEVAREYVANLLVPANAIADALHIAYASVHAIDFLLTWNCRQLAKRTNFDTCRSSTGGLSFPFPF